MWWLSARSFSYRSFANRTIQGCHHENPFERFGKTLLLQQMGLCEEWKQANSDMVKLPVPPWHRKSAILTVPLP
jgi:hypothetical protein